MNERLASNRLGYPFLTERLKQKKSYVGQDMLFRDEMEICLPLTFFALCVNQTRQEIIIQ